MNEPSRKAPFEGGLATFIAFVINRTAAASRGVHTTVDDYGGVPLDLPSLESAVSYHKYYHYSHWRDCAANVSDVYATQSAAAAEYYATGARLGKP
eukprot:383233-Prymnesium_polylepis.1